MTIKLFRRVRVLLVVVVVTFLVGASVFAQDGQFGTSNNIFARMNAKLDQILANLSPAAPQPAPVTLSTGPLSMSQGDTFECYLTNVSSTSLELTIAARGTTSFQHGPDAVAPGANTNLGTFAAGLRHCEFSFVGFATDVRAHATVDSGGHTVAVAEAR